MSAGGAFGGNRGLRPVPPEKGVFPLDHMHECDLEKKDYLNCLKSSSHQSEKCRQFSKKYLECRMAKNLMARQDMSELGFGKETEAEALVENESKRINGCQLMDRIYSYRKEHLLMLATPAKVLGKLKQRTMLFLFIRSTASVSSGEWKRKKRNVL
ncbi:hypothetical protein EUGRSUZ_F03060 [Eucalyptus grandis]|uniref:Uncharacterized protein n=1 Tax=Eucalyptus grandis TaxID=71139 RepID=A0ACC3KKJ0_EUCGR|nr:hypothetical protein EUGRSUZ_F03060 [Eucalyptus grandis]